MRSILALALLLLGGCSPGLVFNSSTNMSQEEMLGRASLAFVGVIHKQQFDSWPFFRLNLPGAKPAEANYWKILRREVRVELVLRGAESRKVVDIYEIFWTGGASGEWNFTQNGERALFRVRLENGRYHVVRDWWRSIFPVTSGPHSRLPLDDSHPLSERIALMNWWIERDDGAARITFPYFLYNDPAGALGTWRRVKLERGLARHPSAGVRVPACRELLSGGWGQDECWETLSAIDRSHLHDGGFVCCSEGDIVTARRRMKEHDALWWWSVYQDRDQRRVLTAVNDRELRAGICRLYTHEYPGDQYNGCPADQPPPAMIVTAASDVPLAGAWPRTGTSAPPR